MIFRYYCIIAIGEISNLIQELEKISEDKPNILESKDVTICTFNSVATAKEIEDYFKSLDKTFFLFQIGANNTGYNIKNSKIRDGLFLEIEDNIKNKLKDKTDELINSIMNFEQIKTEHNEFVYKSNKKSGSTKEDKIDLNDENFNIGNHFIINQEYYNKMTQKEKEDEINGIIDKGYTNLTKLDKEILKYLTKTK